MVDPVRMSVDTRRCTPELITNPTLAIVTPDSATFAQMMHDLTSFCRDLLSLMTHCSAIQSGVSSYRQAPPPMVA